MPPTRKRRLPGIDKRPGLCLGCLENVEQCTCTEPFNGAWMADKPIPGTARGHVEFVTSQFDWDICVSPHRDEAEQWANGDPALEVVWKGVGLGGYPDGATR